MTEAPGELPGSADTKPATDTKPEAMGAASEPQASDDKTSVQLQRGQKDSKSLPGNPGTETGASAQPAAQSVQHSLPAAEPSQPASGDSCVSVCCRLDLPIVETGRMATWHRRQRAVEGCQHLRPSGNMQLADVMQHTILPTVVSCSADRSHTEVAHRIRPIMGTSADIDRGYTQKQSTTGDGC